MDKKKILETIISLSQSQGFYCRVLNEIRENPEILDYLEKQNFKEPLDLVLYLEE